MVQQGSAKGLRSGKGAESKLRVMQCVRESHGEHDEGPNSNPEITLLVQFKCYAIFPRRRQCCCKNQNKQLSQSYVERNV